MTVGPDNPYRVELDQTAKMLCKVDSKPSTESVRWEYAGRFIDTNFQHIIPQVKWPYLPVISFKLTPLKLSILLSNHSKISNNILIIFYGS